jgi:hypothetical protein
MSDAATAPATAPAAAPAPAAPRPLNRGEVLMVMGGALVLLDVAFFVLARFYYLDKLTAVYEAMDVADPDALASTAAWSAAFHTFFYAFLTFSTVTIGALTAAILWPRQVAHALAALFGALFLVGAGQVLFRSHMPTLIGILQAVLGAMLLRLGLASYRNNDRAAWAFLFALSGVLTVFLLFGAPRINAALRYPGLWYVMTLPGVMAAFATALYRVRKSY